MNTQTEINIEAKRSFNAPISIRRNDRDRMTVTLKAYRLGRNSHPHFSATASSLDCGGCLHDEIRQVWPEAKPIIRLHLSNADDGEPMYAEDNGYYWLAGAVGGLGEQYTGANGSGATTPEECLQILADHLRISLDAAAGIANTVHAAYIVAFNTHETPVPGATLNRLAPFRDESRKVATVVARNVFHDYVNEQRPRWQAEATAGLALIQQLSTKGDLMA